MKTGTPSVAGVAFPIAVSGIYDYRIPPQYQDKIACGMPVLVSLRNRNIWGVVVSLSTSTNVPHLKDVLSLHSSKYTSSESALLQLYQWIASYYQCSIGKVFKPFLRKGIVSKSPKTIIEFIPNAQSDASVLNKKYQEIFSTLLPIVPFTVQEAQEYGISRTSVDYLRKHGFLETSKRTIIRNAFECRQSTARRTTGLTAQQQDVVRRIVSEDKKTLKPFLLYGITGSGKTHVYIAVASHVLEQGKGVIILVPEIALTQQTIQRFREALGDVLTVIHSHMTDGERHDSLQELVTGKKRMVIGVRSAVLAPVQNCGCIIVDEEHDGSYKQSDTEPRYNARDVAVMRGKLQQALVVLGSATPSMESYYNALHEKYQLLTLNSRYGEAVLPEVRIVDMRREKEHDNYTTISSALHEAIIATIEAKKQVILLLNRRGFSTVLLCQECGYTALCPECSVTLRYHRADTTLKCHICGHMEAAPHCCPSCLGEKIRYNGTGIQKVEELLHEQFPTARVLRMDQDSTRKKGAHSKILWSFAHGEADILLGTQMVAKGLDFPGVALVGVLAADTGLHIPDFRASERTFQLLTQVAGRAGRADTCGDVIVQTYCPEEQAVIAAATHDYDTYFQQELLNREALLYPPYSWLVRIVVEGKNEQMVNACIQRISLQIRYLLGEKYQYPLLGPAPAAIERIKGDIRYTLLLKSLDRERSREVLSILRNMNGVVSGSLKLIIDVDPINML